MTPQSPLDGFSRAVHTPVRLLQARLDPSGDHDGPEKGPGPGGTKLQNGVGTSENELTRSTSKSAPSQSPWTFVPRTKAILSPLRFSSPSSIGCRPNGSASPLCSSENQPSGRAPERVHEHLRGVRVVGREDERAIVAGPRRALVVVAGLVHRAHAPAGLRGAVLHAHGEDLHPRDRRSRACPEAASSAAPPAFRSGDTSEASASSCNEPGPERPALTFRGLPMRRPRRVKRNISVALSATIVPLSACVGCT